MRPLTSCEPAVGSLAGLVLLHETLSPIQVVAITLIVVAAAGATATAARNGRKEAVVATA